MKFDHLTGPQDQRGALRHPTAGRWRQLRRAVAPAMTALCTIVVGVVAFAQPAGAYAVYTSGGVSGPRWLTDYRGAPCGPSTPDAAWNPCLEYVQVDSSISSRSGWSQTANVAIGAWYSFDNIKHRLAFNYTQSVISSVQSIPMKAADLGGPNAQGATTLGSTSVQWQTTTKALISATITINTNSSIPWCTTNQIGCPSPSQQDLSGTMTHELGHAFGLTHPTFGPNSWSIMECYRAQGELGYTQSADWNGQLYLYSGHASDYGSPGPQTC